MYEVIIQGVFSENEANEPLAISQETSKNMEEPLKPAVKRKLEILKKAVRDGKEPRMLLKSERAQHKPFSCDLCTLAFTRASHLARHRRVHTGERPFACSICPRMFARQDKLKQHLDSHLQWPKRRAQAVASLPGKGKRGRPRKVDRAIGSPECERSSLMRLNFDREKESTIVELTFA